jgi:hypothetical protein
VFDAFLMIYKARTEDLLRIGGITGGGGKRLDAELATRLTREAAKSADHVLRMCIRALDYLPPVDVRFGEFLRGIITADNDLVPNDPLNYRIVFAEAFRRRGIMASDCLSMSPQNLLWETPEQMFGKNPPSVSDIKGVKLDIIPHYRRDDIIRSAEENRKNIWRWLNKPDSKRLAVDLAWEEALGVYFMMRKKAPKSISWKDMDPKVEVHSVRTTRRSGPDGQDVRQLVIEVTQRRRGYFDPKLQAKVDAGEKVPGPEDFVFRGGATLIIDLRENCVRYVIRKRIDDNDRLNEQRELLAQPDGLGFTYLPPVPGQAAREPFAMTHRRQ